jgi:hypothetical protein
MAPRFRALNSAVAQLLDEFSLVSFLQLDINDEDSIGEVRPCRFLLGWVCVSVWLCVCAWVRVRVHVSGRARGRVERRGEREKPAHLDSVPTDPTNTNRPINHPPPKVLAHVDMAVQFGEDADVKIRDYDEGGDGGGDEMM